MTYPDGEKMACRKCGERFPFKVVINKNVPAPCAASQPIEPDKFAEEREYMKNKLSDLNNHLFEQLERLNTTDLQGDKLSKEIERSKAVTSVAHEIILNGKLTLDAIIAVKEKGINNLMPTMLAMEEKKK
jgi:translation initiation factor IF-2